ncbi:MAG: NADH-quinone oxidoreductase subunit B family protein [Candidatus Aenigmarchaeota archaeon]|nr:NADH-quinone oxidoreductase subunit B family protein [Candidatus Aenigmarchaeota archaeon]
MAEKIRKYCQRKSPWIFHFDTGSCNGCDIELLAAMSPKYDFERFGCLLKGSPRHADIFLVTGPVTRKCKDRLVNLYEQIPEPKVVIAMGACAVSKGIFQNAYGVCGPLDKIIPVDVYISGCPAKPEAIIDGIRKGVEILTRKSG